MYISRLLAETIRAKILTSTKVVVLYGPRQVGKTTLFKRLAQELGLKTLYLDAEDARYLEVLSSKNVELLRSLTAGYELLVIDEAQHIPDIGITLKLMHDHLPELRLLVSGSSSFELSNNITEPLTGRHWSFTLYPLSYAELALEKNPFELNQALENVLVYGSYPETFSTPSAAEKREYLHLLSSSYLFKDVLQIVQVRNSLKLRQMLKLLAYQIGSQVSMAELANRLDMGKETVARYIDLMEKSFVLFRLGGLSRNLRNEVTKMDKIYFYDLGIRNALIDSFLPLSERNDLGQLWENFLIAERLKRNAYLGKNASAYFWRLSTGAEVDYVEEREGRFSAYEFKWSEKQSARMPASWQNAYPASQYQAINRSNYLPFICEAD
ncbi:MAG: ATP-binding protein [Anaerolineales bacterium]